MSDTKAKLLQFGAKLKSSEQFTTGRIRTSDVQLIRNYCEQKGISMTLTDAISFAIKTIYGGK